ncbi:hypothetical protein TWF281_007891 [Arthrobotrys megalospora]
MTAYTLITLFLFTFRLLAPQFTTAWCQINRAVDEKSEWFGQLVEKSTRVGGGRSTYNDTSQCHKLRGSGWRFAAVAIWNRQDYDANSNIRAVGFYTGSHCDKTTKQRGVLKQTSIRRVPYMLIVLDPTKIQGISVINLVGTGVEGTTGSWKPVDVEKEQEPGGFLANVPDAMLSGSVLAWKEGSNAKGQVEKQGWAPITGGITHIDPGIWNSLMGGYMYMYLKEMLERTIQPNWREIPLAIDASRRSFLLLKEKLSQLTGPEAKPSEAQITRAIADQPYASIEQAKPYVLHPFVDIESEPETIFQAWQKAHEVTALGRGLTSNSEARGPKRGTAVEGGTRDRRVRELTSPLSLGLPLWKILETPLAVLKGRPVPKAAIDSSLFYATDRDKWMEALEAQLEHVVSVIDYARGKYDQYKSTGYVGSPQGQQENMQNQIEDQGVMSDIKDQLRPDVENSDYDETIENEYVLNEEGADSEIEPEDEGEIIEAYSGVDLEQEQEQEQEQGQEQNSESGESEASSFLEGQVEPRIQISAGFHSDDFEDSNLSLSDSGDGSAPASHEVAQPVAANNLENPDYQVSGNDGSEYLLERLREVGITPEFMSFFDFPGEADEMGTNSIESLDDLEDSYDFVRRLDNRGRRQNLPSLNG